MSTLWTLKAYDLSTGMDLRVLDAGGWDSHAGKRGGDYTIPFQAGDNFIGRKSYAAKEGMLRVLVMGTDAAGAVTHVDGAEGHLRENLDQLLWLMTSNQQISLTRTTGTLETREALVEFVDLAEVQTVRGDSLRVVEARYKMALPFWRQLPINANQTSPIGNEGNAPVTDPILNFTGSGQIRITNGSNGDWVEVDTAAAGGPVVVDVGARTVLQGSTRVDATLSVRNGHWMHFGANATTSFSVTGGIVTVDFYHKWH